jgi:hypothetical protein
VREEEFRGDGEAAGQAASAFPQLVADVLDRLDGLDREGDLLRSFAMWTSTVRSITWVTPPPDLREDRLAGRTRPEEERSAWRMRNSLEVRATRHLAPDLVAARVHPQIPVRQHRRLGFLRPGTAAARSP